MMTFTEPCQAVAWPTWKAQTPSRYHESATSIDSVWDIEWSQFAPQWGARAVQRDQWKGSSDETFRTAPTQQTRKNTVTPQFARVADAPDSNCDAARRGWDRSESTAEMQKRVAARFASYRAPWPSSAAPSQAPSQETAVREPTTVPHNTISVRQEEAGSVNSINRHSTLPSVGSVGHDEGTCKRCAFFPKGRCKNGDSCTHCHFEHPKPLRRRRRDRSHAAQHEHGTLEPNEDSDADLSAVEYPPLVSFQQSNTEKAILQADLLPVIAGDDYYRVHILPQCSKKFWDNLHAQFVVSETGQRHHVVAQPSPKTAATLEAIQKNYDEGDDASTHAGTVASPSSDAESLPVSEAQGLDSAGEEIPAALPNQDTKYRVPWSLPSQGCASVSQNLETAVRPSDCSSKAREFGLESVGSWSAQQRFRRLARETGEPAELSPEEVSRKTKGLLNKLTQERFDSLSQQILALPLKTQEHMAGVVAEIFEKATTQKGFLSLYTELCARIDAHLGAEGDSCVGGKVFRKALVAECQASFERNLQQPLDLKTLEGLSYEERYVQEVKHKTRVLGNMRFIGELLLRKLLAGKILFFIVNEMLDICSEASLESLVELLAIVSPTLEQKGTIYEAPLREVFGALKKKRKDQNISMCIRCKICDLLDARSRGWVARGAQQTTKDIIRKR